MSREHWTPAIRLRIDVSPRSSVGPGKIALLERIEATGSLSQAARELGMSYRRAWLLLDDLNRAFARPATANSVGGTGGGGARVTEFGRALIAVYREIERAANAAARAPLAWLADASTPSTGARHTARRPIRRTGARTSAAASRAARGRPAKRR